MAWGNQWRRSSLGGAHRRSARRYSFGNTLTNRTRDFGPVVQDRPAHAGCRSSGEWSSISFLRSASSCGPAVAELVPERLVHRGLLLMRRRQLVQRHHRLVLQRLGEVDRPRRRRRRAAPLMPAAKLRPVDPARPQYHRSCIRTPWSPVPSTTAILVGQGAPRKRSPATPRKKASPWDRAVQHGAADDDVLRHIATEVDTTAAPTIRPPDKPLPV